LTREFSAVRRGRGGSGQMRLAPGIGSVSRPLQRTPSVPLDDPAARERRAATQPGGGARHDVTAALATSLAGLVLEGQDEPLKHVSASGPAMRPLGRLSGAVLTDEGVGRTRCAGIRVGVGPLGPRWVRSSGPRGTVKSVMSSIHRTSRTPGTPMTPSGKNGKEWVAGSSPAEGLHSGAP
jgi:hypothetical protein